MLRLIRMIKRVLAKYRERMAALRHQIQKTVFCLKKAVRETGLCLRTAGAADTQLEETRRHMSSLLDSVATGIISLDGRGRIRVFNAAAEMLFNISRAMVLGMPFGEAGRLLPFENHALRTLWERLSDAVWAAGAALDLEYDLAPKSGPRKVISFSVYPLGRTTWSVDNGVVIVFEDITRKKEMEDQISDARKRLQTVFDGITDGIQVVDGELRITAVNRSMTSLMGRKITVGKHCSEACFFSTKICTDCPAMETFHTGQPASVTRKLPRQGVAGADAGERVVEINTFPLLDRANRVMQVVEYIKDVTERVRLAERLEHARRLAELGEMAARIAHELRNPLNAITGAAHYLSTEYAGDETIRKFTDLIKRQSIRVDQVAMDLLNASKPMRLNRTTVNVNAVLGQALSSLREPIHSQGITVESDCAADLPLIQADELQLEQALHNIVRNAVEAMPGGGTLRLATAPAEEGGGVEISVEDTGNGIPEQDRERIFESFFTTKPRGTGLGLTIVQGVLKNHGGKIFVGQAEGGGTRVLVCLPVEEKKLKDEGGKTRDEGGGKRDEGDMIFRIPNSAIRI